MPVLVWILMFLVTLVVLDEASTLAEPDGATDADVPGSHTHPVVLC